MKIKKNIYLHTFTFVVVILALSRCVYDYSNTGAVTSEMTDSIADVDSTEEGRGAVVQNNPVSSVKTVSLNRKPNRILSVPSYKTAFPDSNEVQLASARRYGVSPVKNRVDAEERKSELVYIGANPFYHVDNLRESIPYLVPRANILLQDIGRAFLDSLYMKGVPMHQIIVTSVLRSEEDVERLRQHNLNASENSCHRFGTTFDICYNRYHTVQTEQSPRRAVSNDTLKWVLSEVLRDMREAERCYIKYEVKQGCFHLTVR
jgi:hypothetical protein